MMNFTKLAGLAKKRKWNDFMNEYIVQRGIDPNDQNAFRDEIANAKDLYDGYQDESKFRSLTDEKDQVEYWRGNTPQSKPSWGGILRESLRSQYAHNQGMQEGEFMTVESIGNIFNGVRSVKDLLGNILKGSAEQLVVNFRQQNSLMMELNQRVGMLGELSEDFRWEITKAYPDAIRLGISFDELSESVTDLVEQSGKFRLLSDDTIREMALVSKFAGSLKEYAALARSFEMVGLGVSDMNREVEKAGKSAMSVGLNARQTVAEMTGNLGKLNAFGFKNGVQGLTEMTKKSIEFRMNMNETFKLAEKVWSPEGALDVVANLQMIGGAFGDLNDPIKLMYMATNNVEGLQDALVDASKSLVTFNQEQGRFEITGANLRRAKEMADSMGVSFEELTNGAIAAMERTQAVSEIMSRGLNINEKDKEFLTNLAQMKDGRMTIELPQNIADKLGLEGRDIALESLNQATAEKLLAQRQYLEDVSMKDIARQQVSLIENINRDLSFIAAMARIQAGSVGKNLADELGFDPYKIAVESAKLADKVAAKEVQIADNIKNWTDRTFGDKTQKGQLQSIKNAVNLQPEIKNTKSGSGTSNETVVTHKGEMVISHRSDSTFMDNVRRSWENDPRFTNQAKESFLNNFIPSK